MQGVPSLSHQKMDHVISVPTDLKGMKNTQMYSPAIHRAPSIESLNRAETNEGGNKHFDTPNGHHEGSDDANTSELAQVS